MKWLFDFLFRSSIGRKVVMSLSGIFLILFLLVHLAGNFQLLAHDEGMQFNMYTYFMTHNPIIKTISYLLYFTILLHSIQGILLARYNRAAKGSSYEKKAHANASFFANYMIHLGVVIFIFILIHLYQFWLRMKLGDLPMVEYPGKDHAYKNLYVLVVEAFRSPAYVIFYVISMIVLGMHLWHGFQSAFQTLGLNHPKYNSLIKGLGVLYSVLVAAGFAFIPVYMYLTQA